MESRKKDRGFTDDQRAEIFARDRALCVYSGSSLWILDWGACPWRVDWVDHVRPLAKGGRSVVGNGVCAGYVYNRAKRDRGSMVALFREGLPTDEYFELYERVPTSVSRHLRRFGRLHPSDWFLNRALWHILLGAEVRNARRADGKPFTRGVEYRAKAALGFLLKWRDRCTSVPSLRSRGLTPRSPSIDQEALMWSIGAESVAEVKTAIKLLAPYVESNRLALSWMGQARSAKAWRELSSWVRSNPCVTPRLKKAVKENRARLPLPPD